MSVSDEIDQALPHMISSGAVNFGKQGMVYGQHRPGPPHSFYDRIENMCGKFADKVVLDLGTGPGLLAFDISARGAKQVTGIDIAQGQIDAALHRVQCSTTESDRRCVFRVGSASDTGLPDKSVDFVTVGTAWHWFDKDATYKEVHRILKPGGYLIIFNYVYLTRHSKLAHDTDDLILKYYPQWKMSHFDGNFPQYMDPLILEGKFSDVEQFVYDYDQPFTHEAWLGRIQTCNGVGSGAISGPTLVEFNSELMRLMQEKYSVQPVHIRHRAWCLVARAP